MIELFQYEFMRNAIIAALLTSIACGIVGTYVVIRRIAFISGGIAHAAFGGIGIGYWLGINPIITLLPFSILSAIGIAVINQKKHIQEDILIGVFWSMGMALGIILIGLTPGYAPDLFSYLFGNILTVPFSDIVLMCILDIIIIATVYSLYKEFMAIAFDEEFAEISGIKTNILDIILLSLIAITVVMLVKVVGIILVIALLTIPPAIAQQYTRNMKTMMYLSSGIGMFCTLTGLWLSYIFDLPSGATIILFSGCCFLVSCLACKFIIKQTPTKI